MVARSDASLAWADARIANRIENTIQAVADTRLIIIFLSAGSASGAYEPARRTPDTCRVRAPPSACPQRPRSTCILTGIWCTFWVARAREPMQYRSAAITAWTVRRAAREAAHTDQCPFGHCGSGHISGNVNSRSRKHVTTTRALTPSHVSAPKTRGSHQSLALAVIECLL